MSDFSIWHFLPLLIILLIIGLIIYFARKTTRANNGVPKGIYGWLLFFVITLIIGGINAVSSTHNEFTNMMRLYPDLRHHDDYQLLYKVALSTAWAQAAICAYLIFILKTKKIAGTIKTVITGIWVAGLGMHLVMTAILLLVVPNMFELSRDLVRNLYISPFVYAVVWTLYFKKSKRVKNTYPSLALTPNEIEFSNSTPNIAPQQFLTTNQEKASINHSKDMSTKDRFASVIWWLGSCASIFFLFLAFFSFKTNPSDVGLIVLICVGMWLISASLCYIISGHFKLPPNVKKQTNQ